MAPRNAPTKGTVIIKLRFVAYGILSNTSLTPLLAKIKIHTINASSVPWYLAINRGREPRGDTKL